MGFLVTLKTRNDSDEVIIRGNDDGSVDFVKEVQAIDTKTKEEKTVLAGYKYFTTIESALDRLFRMRCNNRDAATLQELLANVREEREALKKEFEGITTTTVTTARRRRG